MNGENQSQMAHFQRRLEETVAWCVSQDWSANPAKGLRTALFRPSEYRLKGHYDDIFLTYPSQQRQQLVEQIAEVRATLLEKRGITHFSLANLLSGGRLLAFTPDGVPTFFPCVFPAKQIAIHAEEKKEVFQDAYRVEKHRGAGVNPPCCVAPLFFLFLWSPKRRSRASFSLQILLMFSLTSLA